MSDIQKIQLIHDLKSVFVMKDENVKDLLDQIEDEGKKQNIERFFRGYAVEDGFFCLAASLPWIRCIHALDQKQLPESSKSDFQVPDYLILFENFKRECFPIFVDVKSTKGQKKTLEIMQCQANLCEAYSKSINAPFVYAIYWENWQIWTVNTIDQFAKKKKKLSITLEDAIKNDLSPIFGNVTYCIPKIHRLSICDPVRTNTSSASHCAYGKIISDSVSKDGTNYAQLELVESSILDSFSQMQKVSVTEFDKKIKIIEESKSPQILTLLSLISLYVSDKQDFIRLESYRNVMLLIIELLEKIGITPSHRIPSKHSPNAFKLYIAAFSNTSILANYKLVHGISENA
jgi:hypothetical protein